MKALIIENSNKTINSFNVFMLTDIKHRCETLQYRKINAGKLLTVNSSTSCASDDDRNIM